MNVCDILDLKKQELVVINGEARVSAAVGVMQRQNVDAVAVSSDPRRIEGLLTRRELIRAYGCATVEEVNILEVRSLMTRRTVTCSMAEPVREVMGRMYACGTDHAVVTEEDGIPIAILNLSDVIDSRLREAEMQAAEADRSFSAVC